MAIKNVVPGPLSAAEIVNVYKKEDICIFAIDIRFDDPVIWVYSEDCFWNERGEYEIRLDAFLPLTPEKEALFQMLYPNQYMTTLREALKCWEEKQIPTPSEGCFYFIRGEWH